MKNRVLGSTFIVAGTTIGAGMLALPLITASVGWGLSIVLMMTMWAVSAAGGLLLAEVALAYPKASNLHGMAGAVFGKPGQLLSGAASLFLYYALCAAYISATSGQLQWAAQAMFDYQLDGAWAAVIAAAVTALVVSSGTQRVDGINRVLFPLMLVTLGVALFVLLPFVTAEHLHYEPEHLTIGVVLAVLPVLYTSFGFHVVVPTISHYQGANAKGVRTSVLVGSLIPVTAYLLWQVSVNGVLGSPKLLAVEGDLVAGMVAGLVATAKVSWIASVITAFAALALITSFLGVALGLFDYLRDALASRNLTGRAPALVVTFVPPLVIAILSPNSFIAALGYAALALVFLAAFLPAAMAWKIRETKRISPAIIIAIVGGLVIVGVQIAITMGFLQPIG